MSSAKWSKNYIRETDHPAAETIQLKVKASESH